MTYSLTQDDELTVECYASGRYRLCLDTSDPSKIPRFREALDCIEAMLKLSSRHCAHLPACDNRCAIDGDWSE